MRYFYEGVRFLRDFLIYNVIVRVYGAALEAVLSVRNERTRNKMSTTPFASRLPENNASAIVNTNFKLER